MVENIENKSARDIGYDRNKDVVFSYIKGLYIKNFRSFKDREVKLGKVLTIIAGKNGTMKSSLLGLIAHPFSSPNDARDLFGQPLKTQMQSVFRLSFEKDNETMVYYLNGVTDQGEEIYEKIRLYSRENEGRFRVTVGRDHSAGLGNFHLNTNYLSLKRLYPLIETNSEVYIPKSPYSKEEQSWLGQAYFDIIQKKTFEETEPVYAVQTKSTLGPRNTYYDYQTISSGEDNLGAIFNKMLAFMRAYDEDKPLNGIFCIDEIEASLHPVSQLRLVRFLYNWAKKYRVQVVFTTHSLNILDYSMELQKLSNSEDIVINNISTMEVGDDNNFNIMVNPPFEVLFKELTFKDITQQSIKYKVNLIFEDKVAKHFFQQIFLRRTHITKHIDYICNLNEEEGGNPWKGLISLVKNGKKLLQDSVIILDPDVPYSEIDRYSDETLLRFPSEDELLLPIEKRVVKYIDSLPGDDPLFKMQEKMSVSATFADSQIELNNLKSQKSRNYKRWAEQNDRLYKAALRQYIKSEDTLFEGFREKVVAAINAKRAQYSLPKLVL